MSLVKPFSFELPTRIEFGAGASSAVVDVLKEMGKERPLVVTDPGLIAAGIAVVIIGVLQDGYFAGVHGP